MDGPDMGDLKRRGSYPIQTPHYTPHSHPMPPESVQEKPQPLPKAIRALKDARIDHGRTMVVCLDGTGDQFDSDNSNVVHFVSCLKKHTPALQQTYYQSGIGTYDNGGLKNGIGAALDMAVGTGLGIHVIDAYKFLMQNYREGDKICLLGFSRGAYTVRCLAGMLHKVGLLPASNGAQVHFAYDFYKDDSTEGSKLAADFKKTFCTDVNVYFVGLWDCVASVGFIPRKLPFSKNPTKSIGYFRHAIALDEHRAKFKVCHWQHTNWDVKRQPTFDDTPGAKTRRGLARLFPKKTDTANANQNGFAKLNGHTNNEEKPLTNGTTHRSSDTSDLDQDQLEAYFDKYDEGHFGRREKETDALEVWFMGCHADVGGGAEKNEERHKLAQIPLRWMLRECFACDTGILFDTAALIEQGLDIHSLYPMYKPQTIPTCGPPPALVEKYEAKALAPLKFRKALFSFVDSDDDEDDVKDDQAALDPFLARLDKQHIPLCDEVTECHFDAMASCNDMLKAAKIWWILEIWPIKLRIMASGGVGWKKVVRMNLGRYRAVRDAEPKMHWTVKQRMDEGKYVLRSRCDGNTSWQVVA